MKPELVTNRPSVTQIESEIDRIKTAGALRTAALKAMSTLIVFAAAAVLISTLLINVISVQQNSMSPTIQDGDTLIFIKGGNVNRGDIIAFHHNNQVLIKRVIAAAGELVDIDRDGIVSVNGERLTESYLNMNSRGECTIDFPFHVPENQFFVMGDNRAASLDSRLSVIGTIHKDRIVGKAVGRIWPLQKRRHGS